MSDSERTSVRECGDVFLAHMHGLGVGIAMAAMVIWGDFISAPELAFAGIVVMIGLAVLDVWTKYK